jgi:hypothetical protein
MPAGRAGAAPRLLYAGQGTDPVAIMKASPTKDDPLQAPVREAPGDFQGTPDEQYGPSPAGEEGKPVADRPGDHQRTPDEQYGPRHQDDI